VKQRQDIYKKHVLLVFWDKNNRKDLQGKLGSLKIRFPTIKVKVIEFEKDWRRPIQHKISQLPTVILLKDGIEVDRIEDNDNTILELLFRKATT